MSSRTGRFFSVQLFGESHGSSVGVTVDGLPAGLRLPQAELDAFLGRRAPGRNGTSARRESDTPHILSGMYDGYTTGTPLTTVFENKDARRDAYAFLPDCPRPGHADLPAYFRSRGYEDLSGGGHHSGRLTAPYCFAGFVAMKMLETRGITVASHLLRVGAVEDASFPPESSDPDRLLNVRDRMPPVLNPVAGQAMLQALERAAREGDSLGGTVECVAFGVPAGWGAPYFENAESLIASQLFAIPGVKAVEFGAGTSCASMKGSEYNDAYTVTDAGIRTETNRCGGLLGGMANGMPVLCRASFRPTASIALPQQTVSFSEMKNTTLSVQGRHDPCIALRAVPVVESAVAIALCELLLESVCANSVSSRKENVPDAKE